MTSITENAVGLSWAPPEDDGGSDIFNYVVEKREPSKRSWQKVDSTDDLVLTATDLKEGTSYLFRVAAENDVGLGEYTDLGKPVTPKSEFGECRFLYFSDTILFFNRLILTIILGIGWMVYNNGKISILKHSSVIIFSFKIVTIFLNNLVQWFDYLGMT